jgi:hypothetical protein
MRFKAQIKLLAIRTDLRSVAPYALGGDLHSAWSLLELIRRESQALRLSPKLLNRAIIKPATGPIPRRTR